MAKTYLSSAKYIIHMKLEISGIVDNPDIVGAIFGQSEGLLGEEMDLKELQQSGKVGRIEIRPQVKMGKTVGMLTVPTSMDSAQTAVLAAAIESVDKVGPYEAEFKTVRIEDARSMKRAELKDRAQDLLQQFMEEQAPETSVITSEVKTKVRLAEIKSYGPDKLPCGPDVFEADEVIVVEGRADVLNLLKNGIKNAVGFGGAKISPTIVDLARGRKVIAFADGDRGGELILRKLQGMINIDAIARAPAGKEVEELERKEIIAALRKAQKPTEETGKAAAKESAGALEKVKSFFGVGAPSKGISTTYPKREFRTTSYPRYPRKEYTPRGPRGFVGERGRTSYSRGRPTRTTSYGRDRSPGRAGYEGSRAPKTTSYEGDRSLGRASYGRDRAPRTTGYGTEGRRRITTTRDRPGTRSRGPSVGGRARGRPPSRGGAPRGRPRRYEPQQIERAIPEPVASAEEKALYGPIMDPLKGSLKAKLFDEKMQEIKEINTRELKSELEGASGVKTVVFDGVVTQNLMDAAENAGIETVVAIRKGKVKDSARVKVVIIKP